MSSHSRRVSSVLGEHYEPIGPADESCYFPNGTRVNWLNNNWHQHEVFKVQGYHAGKVKVQSTSLSWNDPPSIEVNITEIVSSDTGASALMMAVLRSNQEDVPKFASQRSMQLTNPWQGYCSGTSALMMAAHTNQVPLIPHLIGSEFKLDYNDDSALTIACKKRHVEFVNALCSYRQASYVVRAQHSELVSGIGAIVHENDPLSRQIIDALMKSMKRWKPEEIHAGNVILTKELVFDYVDYLDNRGNTFLNLSAEKGWTELVEKLLKRGVDPDIQNAYGYTAMFTAII